MAPIRVNLLRPKCFCGLTSVSIYPEPPIDVSAPKTVHKKNWAYECHYTPKQKNMARPDPCDDCEDERRRRSIRPTELKASSFLPQATPPLLDYRQSPHFGYDTKRSKSTKWNFGRGGSSVFKQAPQRRW
ncbi:hypothetical protein BGX24_011953 [Mortierella sp. AD032]|nr:hypothetical protein BGX24_011953 [Mortierella sp. AD032]